MFRTYEPATGRYLQSDPMGLFGGQSSTYAYVGNYPLSNVDPLGLDDTQCMYSPAACGMSDSRAVVSNASIGVNETAVGAIIGEQGEFGFAADSTGTMCVYAMTCAMAATGGGVAANVSLSPGAGTGKLSSGDYDTVMIAADGGDIATAGGAVQLDPKARQISVSKGYFGPGGGAYAGMFLCRSHYYCSSSKPPQLPKKKNCK